MAEPVEKVDLERRAKELRREVQDKNTRLRGATSKVEEAKELLEKCRSGLAGCRAEIRRMREDDLVSVDAFRRAVDLKESYEDLILRHTITIRNGRRLQLDLIKELPLLEAELVRAELGVAEWGVVLRFPVKE